MKNPDVERRTEENGWGWENRGVLLVLKVGKWYKTAYKTRSEIIDGKIVFTQTSDQKG